VILLCLVGVYTLNNSMLDVWITVIMGGVGYGLRKLRIDPAPLVIALVLGPMIEKAMRQSLFLAAGDWMYLLKRPISGAVVGLVAIFLAANFLLRTKRQTRSE
jgi:putative tricarboxylic transport membrane protein